MFLIPATVSDCRAPIADLRFAAFPVLTGEYPPVLRGPASPDGPIAAHRLPCRRIGRARCASGGGAVQSVRSAVRLSAAPARPASPAAASSRPSRGIRSIRTTATPISATRSSSIRTSNIGQAWARPAAFNRSRCLRRPVERPRRCPAASRSRACPVSASRAARRSRPTPRRSRATRSSPSRRRRRSPTRARCSPASTRSPAASSISTSRSARRCSSARCR